MTKKGVKIMSDTDLKGQNEAEEQTAEPMPSSDQPVDGIQEPTLPDGVSERTAEEFEKLKAANKALKEQLETRSNPNNSFEFIPPMLDESLPNEEFDVTTPSPQAGETSFNNEDFVDEGGYVDTARLNSTLKEAKREAQEAKKAIARLQQERQQEKLELLKAKAFTQFPEFVAESGDRFDPGFDHKVKLELTRQLVEEGKQDYLKAAKNVKDLYYPKPSSAETAKREEIISSREQASTQTSAGTGSSEPTNHEELVEGTKQGDAEAIYKRLQASGN